MIIYIIIYWSKVNRYINKENDRLFVRYMNKQMESKMNRQRVRQIDSWIDRQLDRQIVGQMDRSINELMYLWHMDRQIDTTID